MDRDKSRLALELSANVDLIDKSLDDLAEFKVFSYCYMLLSERIFQEAQSEGLSGYESAYLKGAQDVLTTIQNLPSLIFEINKTQKGK